MTSAEELGNVFENRDVSLVTERLNEQEFRDRDKEQIQRSVGLTHP